MTTQIELGPAVNSVDLAEAIASTDFSRCAATVVGYGVMGQEYVKALQRLGVRAIRVCARSAARLEGLRQVTGIEAVAGGVEALAGLGRGPSEELGIVATPIESLLPVAKRLASLGVRRLLIEKPASLWSRAIAQAAAWFDHHGVDVMCAYNRVAYPSVQEARARAGHEGGITSCVYTFTEMVKPDWPQRFPVEELARWGIANSLHVMSLAHGLIGVPAAWQGMRRGGLSWHPSGSIFVGAGVSDRDIPFAYQADWTSTGRWSVEFHTRGASYRLCPLERVFQRRSALSEWEEVPVKTFAPDIKAGILEEVAAMLSPEVRAVVPLISLRRAELLTAYGEQVFGYEP
jgi:hypothetical protein